MKNTNLESSEKKSTSHGAEPHGDSSLASEVADVWSRQNSPTSRVADTTKSVRNNESSLFLDMGTTESLYGKSAAEPASIARADNPEGRNRKHDQHEDHHDTNKKEKKETPVEHKTTGTEHDTKKETQTPKPEPKPEPKPPVGMHPDRLEELSKTRPEEVTKYHDSVKNVEQKKLNDWADKTLQEPDRSKFKQDMQKFEERAKRDGLATADVTVTYREIERLTNAKGETPLTTAERNRLAQQVLHNAAEPTAIDQGQHNTCNVATVESRAYSRTPAAAARLVADIAINGEYRSNDGTVVKVNPKGHNESLQIPTPDGARSHASEIFQVTAVNLHYAKYNAQHGTNLRYEQIEPNAGDKGDHGERLYTAPGVEKVDDKGKPVRSPDLSEGELTLVSNAISSRGTEKDVTLASDTWHSGTNDNITLIHSKEELAAKLKSMKEHNQLPAIIRVNTTAEPFYTDSGQGAAGGSGGAHVVTITDFDEKTGMVTVDNQWGKAADHGKDKPINVRELYTSMQSDTGIEEQLKKEVKTNRDNNTFDAAKEMQLLRMQKLNKSISDADYAKELCTVMENTQKHWNTDIVSPEQKATERLELDRLIHAKLPTREQIVILRKEHQLGRISYEDYRTQLTYAGVKSEKEFNSSSKVIPTDASAPNPVKKHAREIIALNTALVDLTPQDQEWVRQNIKTMSK